MYIKQLDHLVLTVASITRTVHFYCNILGMQKIQFADNRIALAFGNQKINLHETGNTFEPKAAHPLPGSADLCFLVNDIKVVKDRLLEHDIKIIEGPVRRTGATGQIVSVYCRDPDQNLLEFGQMVDDSND